MKQAPHVDPVGHVVKLIMSELDMMGTAAKYGKRNCNTCRGNGYLSLLRKAGAGPKDPRTIRYCACVHKQVLKEANRRHQAALTEPQLVEVEAIA